jgi:hypothetical protein
MKNEAKKYARLLLIMSPANGGSARFLCRLVSKSWRRRNESVKIQHSRPEAATRQAHHLRTSYYSGYSGFCHPPNLWLNGRSHEVPTTRSRRNVTHCYSPESAQQWPKPNARTFSFSLLRRDDHSHDLVVHLLNGPPVLAFQAVNFELF